MLLITNNPSKVELIDFSKEELSIIEKHLKYKDTKADNNYRRMKRARWFVNKYGSEKWHEELDRLKSLIEKSVLFQTDTDKHPWTYSGLSYQIKQLLPNQEIVNKIKYPEPKSIAWDTSPQPLRPFQKESIELFLKHPHAAVEISTGLGKTRILLEISKQLGLKTVIMVPSISIAENIFGLFKKHLGAKYVGMFGNGKKKLGKLITIGIAASLAKVKKGSEAWDDLSKAQVLISDESHLTSAETLERVCVGIQEGPSGGLCAGATRRYFVSATQMRGDGSEIVLKGITGPVIQEVTFQDGVNLGYLAKPNIKLVLPASFSTFKSDDANEMTRAHIYKNAGLHHEAATIANLAIRKGHQVLILIQEVDQFSLLLSSLKAKAGFAHGGLTKDNRDGVPKEYWDSDPQKLVEEFNKGNLPILVGTSCIATGTDILPAKTGIYLMGQSSKIKTLQALGRMTRKVPGKEEFYWFDFGVMTLLDEVDGRMTAPRRHAILRSEYYSDIGYEAENI